MNSSNHERRTVTVPAALGLATLAAIIWGAFTDSMDLVTAASVLLPIILISLLRPLVALALFSASIPLEAAIVLGGPAGSISRISGLILIVAWALSRPRPIAGLFPSWLWAWLLWTIASAAWSPAGLTAVTSLVQLAVVTFVVADLARTMGPRVARIGFGWFSVTALASSFLAIGGFVATGFVTGRERFSGFASQGLADFGGILAMVFVFLFAVVLKRVPASTQARLGAAILLPVAVAGILLSGTRSAWLAALVGGVALVWGQWRWPAVSVAIVVAVLVGATVVGAVVPGAGQSVSTRLEESFNTGGTGRTVIWSAAWDVFQDVPIAGVGLDGFRYTDASINVESRFLSVVGEGVVAHSIFMRNVVESGLVGAILFLGFLLSLVFSFRHGVPRWLVAELLALLSFGLFHEMYRSKYWWLVVGLIFGIRAYNIAIRPSGERERDEERLVDRSVGWVSADSE